MSSDGPWIGVDLDGTLAHYEGWDGGRVGAPIQPMVDRVKGWLAAGKTVRIVTARVSVDASPEERSQQRRLIQAWCAEHLGQALAVTCEKDFGMLELWDDRAVQVVKNTGLTREEAGGPAAAAAAITVLTGPAVGPEEGCSHTLIVSLNAKDAVCCVCRMPLPSNGAGITVRAPQ